MIYALVHGNDYNDNTFFDFSSFFLHEHSDAPINRNAM